MRFVAAMWCLLLLLVGCGHASDEPGPTAGDAPSKVRFVAGERRLLGLTEHGQVVSRRVDGTPDRIGEGGKWTWKALGTLSCPAAREPFTDAMTRLHMLDGALTRFEPLPAEYVGNEWSLDGEIGWWEGFAGLWQRCPDYRSELGEAWALHKDKRIDLPPAFDAVEDQIGAMMGTDSAPTDAKVDALGAELAGWVGLTVAARAACFRINLAIETVGALERAGGSFPGHWRDIMCAVTKGVGVVTYDHWCGRPGLEEFIDNFHENVYEYVHQRCTTWETPDANGLETPGLDELVALRLKYGETL